MRIVIQRVSKAAVTVNDKVVGNIDRGLCVLLGVGQNDTQKDADYLIRRMLGLRIFNDEKGKMNLSVKDVGGDVLVISQFTLYADTQKGNRPSFTSASSPQMAEELYNYFVRETTSRYPSGKLESGKFGADMQVSLVNDGPVTIVIDSAQNS